MLGVSPPSVGYVADSPAVSSPQPIAGAEQAVASVRAALPTRTQRCLLREVSSGDVAEVHGYRSDPLVTEFLGHPPLDLAGVRRLVGQWARTAETITVVADANDGVVGDIRLRFRPAAALAPATTSAVEAVLGYAFHPAVHGRGIATECVGSLIEIVRTVAPVRRITARVFAPAVRSSALLARLGFTRDGIDREAVLAPDGSQWWDDELWSLLATDQRGPGHTVDQPLS